MFRPLSIMVNLSRLVRCRSDKANVFLAETSWVQIPHSPASFILFNFNEVLRMNTNLMYKTNHGTIVYCSQINYNTWGIKPQTNPENRYKVSKTENGLICECLDHTARKSDCKHIQMY